jgi:hypothetical protein
MSKISSAALIAVLTLSFVVTYAEENSDTPSRSQPVFPQWSVEMKENKGALQTDLAAKRDAWREELAAKREEFRKAGAEAKLRFWNGAKRMLGERFTAAVTNLERAQTRVQGVIDRMEDAGKDTGDAQALLDDSKEKLEDAKDKIEEIQALLPDTGEEVTPELFEQIKLKAREAKDLIKESHRALVDSIIELRAALAEDNDDNDDDEDEDEN